MSVQKFDAYNPRIEHEAATYTSVDTFVIQNITNMEAGFVWIYLLSKPKDWKVIKEHLKNHFRIGDSRIKSIFAWLARHRLIEYIQENGAQGRFGKHDIRVLNGSLFTRNLSTDRSRRKPTTGATGGSGMDTPVKCKNNEQYNSLKDNEIKNYPQDSTGGSVYRPAVHRTTGSGALHIKETTDKRKRERGALSGIFEPDQKNTMLCHELRLDPVEELESFANRHRGEKTQYEFARWLKNSYQYHQRRRISVQQLSMAAVSSAGASSRFWGPGHPDWERLNGNGSGMNRERSDGQAAGRDHAGCRGVQNAESHLLAR